MQKGCQFLRNPESDRPFPQMIRLPYDQIAEYSRGDKSITRQYLEVAS